MCIFTAAIEHVGGTRIFARRDGADRQILVYSMRVSLASDAAMVLPLPVPPETGDAAVEFIDLSGFASFFDELDRAFPKPPASRGLSVDGAIGGALQAPRPLVVHDVGDFEASFVPTAADFHRLDPRFRLAPEIWEALPGIADWGFAVFKLRAPEPAPQVRSWWSRLLGKPPAPAVSPKTIHPMALSFPTRRRDAIFFPTVHVHDGLIHDTAPFDHALYLQLSSLERQAAARRPLGVPSEARTAATLARPDWDRSRALMADIIDKPTSGVIDLDDVAHKSELSGLLPNRDTWVEL